MIKYLLSLTFILVNIGCMAQDDLLKMVNNDSTEKLKTVYTSATFKGSRIINGQTIETIPKSILQFMISHRFGTINT